MTDHIVKESTGDMRVTGMLTGNDPGAALRGDNLERLKARDEYLSQWAVAEIERLQAELYVWRQIGQSLHDAGLREAVGP